jgi:hypothetical protein
MCSKRLQNKESVGAYKMLEVQGALIWNIDSMKPIFSAKKL